MHENNLKIKLPSFNLCYILLRFPAFNFLKLPYVCAVIS